jgi:hypothetical protein
MRAQFVVVTAGLLVACKGAPPEPPPGDAGYVRGASDGAQPPAATSPTTTIAGPLNSHLAQSEGMRVAQERWGYHPREATAWRAPSGDWRVTVIFQEPNVTANVYFSPDGKVLDGGVFGETDH